MSGTRLPELPATSVRPHVPSPALEGLRMAAVTASTPAQGSLTLTRMLPRSPVTPREAGRAGQRRSPVLPKLPPPLDVRDGIFLLFPKRHTNGPLVGVCVTPPGHDRSFPAPDTRVPLRRHPARLGQSPPALLQFLPPTHTPVSNPGPSRLSWLPRHVCELRARGRVAGVFSLTDVQPRSASTRPPVLQRAPGLLQPGVSVPSAARSVPTF